jgi:hypothetical protein
MFTRRSDPPPARPATLHVQVVRSNFEVREENAPAPPRFVRRSPVPESVPQRSGTEPEEPFIKPPSLAQLMSRR